MTTKVRFSVEILVFDEKIRMVIIKITEYKTHIKSLNIILRIANYIKFMNMYLNNKYFKLIE